MRPLLMLILTLVPQVVLAQTMSVTINGANTEASFARDACNDDLVLTWRVDLTTATVPLADRDGNLRVWISSSATCAADPTAADKTETIADWQGITGATGQIGWRVSDLPIFMGAACPADLEEEHLICGDFEHSTNPDTAVALTKTKIGSNPKVTYDGAAPATPTIVGTEALDSSIRVDVAADSDTVAIVVEYREVGAATWSSEEFLSTASGGTIKGLTNKVTYEFRALARDDAGNISGLSGVVQDTPIKAEGIFSQLEMAGSAEKGGCSTTGPAALAWLSLAAGWLWQRRRGS